MANANKVTGPIALVLSVIALALSVFAIASRPAQPEPTPDESYDRIVDEVWAMLQPVYMEFDVALSQQEDEPETLRDALAPLLRISRSLDGTPPTQGR